MAMAFRLRNNLRTLTNPPLAHLFSTSKAVSPAKTEPSSSSGDTSSRDVRSFSYTDLRSFLDNYRKTLPRKPNHDELEETLSSKTEPNSSSASPDPNEYSEAQSQVVLPKISGLELLINLIKVKAGQPPEFPSGYTWPTLSFEAYVDKMKKIVPESGVYEIKGLYKIKTSQSDCGSSRVQVDPPPATEKLPKVSKSQRSCSICGKSGHNKRSCPLSHQV